MAAAGMRGWVRSVWNRGRWIRRGRSRTRSPPNCEVERRQVLVGQAVSPVEVHSTTKGAPAWTINPSLRRRPYAPRFLKDIAENRSVGLLLQAPNATFSASFPWIDHCQEVFLAARRLKTTRQNKKGPPATH